MKNGFKSFIVKRYVPVMIVLALAVLAVSIRSTVLMGAIIREYSVPLSLVPCVQDKRDSLYEISTYADNAEPLGKSEVSSPNVTETAVSYSYTLRTGTEYPYVGLSFFARPERNAKIKQHLNFSKYSHIRLKGKIANSSAEQLFIKTIIPGFTKAENRGTEGSYVATISASNGAFDTVIALNELETPDWWYSSNKVAANSLPKEKFLKVVDIAFQNGYDSPYDKQVSVSIDEFVLVKEIQDEMKQSILNSLPAPIILALIMILISVFRFRKIKEEKDKSEKIIISYDRVEIEDEQDNEVQRIVEFIASNYPNPDFSVEQLAKGAGVSTSRIPTLLKKQYNMNFKQYLNTIRITEAKRLLLETEHQIVTIAHSVGYNNIPHFNRTFKQVTGLSPKQYRDAPETAIDNLPGSHLKG